MPITINLRHLEVHERQLEGELPVEELDLDLSDELVHAEQPLRYDFQVERLDQSLLLQGSLELTLRCECARCLKSFNSTLRLTPWARHLPLEGEEKVPIVNDSVDLTPYVREDILLEFPQHPLCEADCPGLPKTAADKPQNTNGSGQQEKSSAWADLDKLKF